MRAAMLLTLGNVAWAGLLVASLAAVISFAILYRLAALDTDRLTAGRTVAYLALFPTAFFLYSAYTESLFLALVLGAFWWARQGRAAPVALLAALAGLTRVQGALVGIPLAVELLVVGGWEVPARLRLSGRAAINAWLARVTPPDAVRPGAAGVLGLLAVAASGGLATLAFFVYRSVVVHDPLFWTVRESTLWQHRTTWPGETLWVAVQTLFGEHAAAIDFSDLAVLLTFTTLAFFAFRLRPAYGLFAILVLGPTWFDVRADFPLVSVSRYALGAFPCFIVLAAWAGRRPRPVHLAIIGLWITWLLVWSSQAIRGYWVG